MYKSLKEEYIIFLDFDGVLNNASCEPEDNFLPEAITVLNKLHEEYQAKIVISSSWRTCYTMKQLMDLLKEHGCLCEVIDKTPEYIGKYEEKSTFLLSELEYEKSLKEEEGRNGEIISYVRIHNIKH